MSPVISQVKVLPPFTTVVGDQFEITEVVENVKFPSLKNLYGFIMLFYNII